MTDDPGVFEIGVCPLVDMEIRATKADAANANQGLRFAPDGFRALLQGEFTGFPADDCLHDLLR
jgi:hypothetical protein